MSGVLEKILAKKREEIDALRSRFASPTDRIPHDVVGALRRASGAPLRLITEIKKKSPSAGALSTKLSPRARALAYAKSGAAMISVLCDEEFFGGGWDDVAAVRAAFDETRVAMPILAKEFVLDEAQLAEARERGADAVLLIARIVDAERLRDLVSASRDMGLEPLVEVVTEAELAAALTAKATLIGVNARDLDNLAIDRDHAARLVAAVPASCVPIHLSGLKTPEDVGDVAKTSAHAALVGEALMREDDPAALLAAMVKES
jgi:indole-3-glycerol phosphate synthase